MGAHGPFSQERQGLWLPKDDLPHSFLWSPPSPELVLLHDIHSKLLTQYDCKEGCAPSQSVVFETPVSRRKALRSLAVASGHSCHTHRKHDRARGSENPNPSFLFFCVGTHDNLFTNGIASITHISSFIYFEETAVIRDTPVHPWRQGRVYCSGSGGTKIVKIVPGSESLT